MNCFTLSSAVAHFHWLPKTQQTNNEMKQSYNVQNWQQYYKPTNIYDVWFYHVLMRLLSIVIIIIITNNIQPEVVTNSTHGAYAIILIIIKIYLSDWCYHKYTAASLHTDYTIKWYQGMDIFVGVLTYL